MTVFAMVTTERSRRYTEFALQSFFAATPLSPSDRFVLIDNDSTYTIPSSVSPLPIEIIRNARPRSFAENANAAAGLAIGAKTDLFFLNNDIIFSPRWYAPVIEAPQNALLVPLSNREIQYTLPRSDGAAFSLSMTMELESYLGHEQEFVQISERHRAEASKAVPFLRVLCAPFYAVRIPLGALETIGAFDTRYGVGGAEDYDYCLRAHLADFSVCYLQRSYLLHFGGRSIQAQSGEPDFIRTFREKWGSRLTRVVFDDDTAALEEERIPRYDYQKDGFARLVRELATAHVDVRLPL